MSLALPTPHEPDVQRLAIRGRVWRAGEPGIQEALAAVYGTPERPRCLCMPGGVEMYVAHFRQFVVKRMPNAGDQHHVLCGSFEPEVAQSGLGYLSGSAVRELETGRTELRVDFPWTRRPGHGTTRAGPSCGRESACASISQPREASSLAIDRKRTGSLSEATESSSAMPEGTNSGVRYSTIAASCS